MIQVTGVSIWGAVMLVAMLVLMLGVYWLTAPQWLRRMGRAAGAGVLQLGFVAAYVLLLYKADSWLADAAWIAVMAMALTAVELHRARLSWQRFLWPVVAALLAGLVVAGGGVLLCVKSESPRLLAIPVAGVLLGWLTTGVVGTLRGYVWALHHTRPHRRYLLANGASHLEAVMPSVRRALQVAVMPLLQRMKMPLLVAQPLLMGGLLMGGVTPVVALLTVVAIGMAALVGSVVAAMVLLWLADRLLFDAQGNLRQPSA